MSVQTTAIATTTIQLPLPLPSEELWSVSVTSVLMKPLIESTVRWLSISLVRSLLTENTLSFHVSVSLLCLPLSPLWNTLSGWATPLTERPIAHSIPSDVCPPTREHPSFLRTYRHPANICTKVFSTCIVITSWWSRDISLWSLEMWKKLQELQKICLQFELILIWDRCKRWD